MLEWRTDIDDDSQSAMPPETAMQDGIYRAADLRASGASGGVSEFASEVVARLVARDSNGGVVLQEGLVSRFMDAVRSTDPQSFEALKPELKRARISAATLADVYIPEVARRLGRGWEDDVVSFAEVTMGAARLQAVLREIGAEWSANTRMRDGAGTMLLILPAGEQHTLGAMVIAGWLRRQGISVCLRIGPSLADLASLMALRKFDGVMISVAGDDKLEVCAKLVKTLREAVDYKLRVAVGGAIMAREAGMEATLGADIVTNDLPKALAALGLSERRGGGQGNGGNALQG
jgi:methanogenic corrinoid protein MtbC1